MRYLNWDVLLFPAASRTPMQEFKAACYIAQDSEVLHNDLGPGDLSFGACPRDLHRNAGRQVPIVACFTANQTDNAPFKVSIHSWTTPPVSGDLRSLEMNSQDKVACFEARVIIDGICVGSTVMMTHQVYPQIIDRSFQIVKNGSRDLLRWPSFHHEMLNQTNWNVGENFGRIKVTIAEGFMHGRQESPFIRTKNVVTFSFQHAPQSVLEHCGIAWPNRSMFMPSPQPVYNIAPTIKDDPIDPQLHAHSPGRQTSGHRALTNLSRAVSINGNGDFMGPPPIPGFPRMTNGISWDGEAKMPDPFVDHRRTSQHRSDQSMPDYGDSDSDKLTGSRNSTELSAAFAMSHIISGSYQPREHFDEIVHIAESPTNQQGGLLPPANTRTNSTEGLDHQTVSNDQQRRSSSQRHSNRESSDITMKSEFSEDQEKGINPATNRTFHVPSGNVKSKKEGISPRRETPPVGQKQAKPADGKFGSPAGENEVSKGSSEGKRKRDNKTGRKVSMTDHLELPSPRKVSKMEGEGSPSGDSRTRHQSATERCPLGTLGNA